MVRYWQQRLRINAHPFNLGLGTYPIVTLAEARAAALANARAVHQGQDPRRQSRIPTFEQAAGKVHALHAPTWRSPKNAALWWSTVERFAFPVIGTKPVDRVTTGDVLRILTPIWTEKKETARKLRQRIGAVMQWAIAEGHRTDDPAGPALTAALPKNGTTPKRHHRALPHSEVADAIRRVQASRAWPATKLLFEYIVLTACRSGEAREATWDEVNPGGRVWTVPAERMKVGKEHRVPLSTRAVEVLREAATLRDGSGLLFPSPTGKPLSNMTTSKLLKETGIDAVTHGFRTSFRTWAADNNESRDHAELCLAHAVKGIEGSYQRSDVLEIRRGIMQRWSDYCTPKV